MRYTLTQTEFEICSMIGRLRHAHTSAVAKEQMQMKGGDPIQIAIDGVMTEYVVSRALNLHFDMNCNVRPFGPDFTHPSGLTIDVKSTRTLRGNLNARKNSTGKQGDVFILCEIHSIDIEIVGSIKRDLFLIDENIKTRNDGGDHFYSISRDRLKPFEGI